MHRSIILVLFLTSNPAAFVSAQPIRTTIAHDGIVLAAAYRPDGAQLATGGFDRTVKIWDAAHATLLHTLTGHDADLTALAFSPDGATLVSCDSDGHVFLWKPGQSSA